MGRRITYRKKSQNRVSMFLVLTIVLMMLIVVSYKSIGLREKRNEYSAREAVLEEEIAREQIRSEEIAEYEKYTQTKKYVEEVAREKLGMVYEGEIVFKDEK